MLTVLGNVLICKYTGMNEEIWDNGEIQTNHTGSIFRVIVKLISVQRFFTSTGIQLEKISKLYNHYNSIKNNM